MSAAPAKSEQNQQSRSASPGGRQNPTGNPLEPRLQRIARRAHEIYEARGGEDGKAMEDWLQAEREIDAQMAAEDPGTS